MVSTNVSMSVGRSAPDLVAATLASSARRLCRASVASGGERGGGVGSVAERRKSLSRAAVNTGAAGLRTKGGEAGVMAARRAGAGGVGAPVVRTSGVQLRRYAL